MIFFEWDPAKARSNQRKHGVSFEIARYVFDDPDALIEHDFVEDNEQRWRTLRQWCAAIAGGTYSRI